MALGRAVPGRSWVLAGLLLALAAVPGLALASQEGSGEASMVLLQGIFSDSWILDHTAASSSASSLLASTAPDPSESLPFPRVLPDAERGSSDRALPFPGWVPLDAQPGTPSAAPSSGTPAYDPLAPLRRPLETPPPRPDGPAPNGPPPDGPPLLLTPFDAPLGFTGPSGVRPSAAQESSHFVPVEDRWRVGFPPWDRYGKGHPPRDDYPFVASSGFASFNQSVFKGDYPFLGQNTFLSITGQNFSIIEPRQLPTQTTPFESTSHPAQYDFFGRTGQFFFLDNTAIIMEMFHGNAGFKQPDWRIKLVPIFDVNSLAVNELAQINPNVEKGATRNRTWWTLQEWWGEAKLADLSPNFDFVSARIGSQPFISDFRGFIFNDINRAVRIFGTRNSNRDQFNLLYFRQQEKDVNSLLNSFNDRGQDLIFANYFRQDFIWPGYTTQLNFAFDHDAPAFHFDQNGFLTRPDPVGAFRPHEVDAFYLGWTGDGHINRINISHAAYLALGHDTLNPLANQPQTITAGFAAAELSYDRDYVRFRTSGMFATGDSNVNNSHATGFDSILDFPNFAGGQFTYWQRQAIPLFGVNLNQRFSFLPDLRSNKFQGQANFVNPGFGLYNLGFDVDLAPRLKSINNCNFMWFDTVQPLQTFLFQDKIRHFIGVDLSSGIEYRPLLSNNVLVLAGVALLIPGQGFRDIYSRFMNVVDPLLSTFIQTEINF